VGMFWVAAFILKTLLHGRPRRASKKEQEIAERRSPLQNADLLTLALDAGRLFGSADL